jgi:4-amino-4-deoxy-L-arabinose transferase-like glycosyltransferase
MHTSPTTRLELQNRSTTLAGVNTSAWVFMFAVGSVAALALLWRLGAASMESWDEGIYAEVAREMVVRGDWLTPTWNFQLWFEKPPLLLWGMATGFRLFGVNEFWSRAPAAFAGVGLVLVTQAIGARIRNLRTGVLSGLVLLSSYTFLFLARHSMTDVPLCLFLWVGVYAYLRARDGSAAWWLLVWVNMALAFLTKSAAFVVGPAAIGIALMWDGRWKTVARTRLFWCGAALAASVALPWPILMWLRHGTAFLNDFLGYQVISRAVAPLENSRVESLYYFKAMLWGAFPWSLLLPFAVLWGLRESRRNGLYRVVLLVPAVVLVQYFLVRTKLYWYLLPAYPAFAILIASLIDRACVRWAQVRRPILLAFGCAVLLFAQVCLQGTDIVAASRYPTWTTLYDRTEMPLARLGRQAAGSLSGEVSPLVLCSDETDASTIEALFYSGRPVQRAFAFKKPWPPPLSRRQLEKLSALLQAGPRDAILAKELLPGLAHENEITTLGEAGEYAYVRISLRTGTN